MKGFLQGWLVEKRFTQEKNLPGRPQRRRDRKKMAKALWGPSSRPKEGTPRRPKKKKKTGVQEMGVARKEKTRGSGARGNPAQAWGRTTGAYKRQARKKTKTEDASKSVRKKKNSLQAKQISSIYEDSSLGEGRSSKETLSFRRTKKRKKNPDQGGARLGKKTFLGKGTSKGKTGHVQTESSTNMRKRSGEKRRGIK